MQSRVVSETHKRLSKLLNLRSRLPPTPRKWLKRPETLGRRQTRLHECDPGPPSLRTASRNLRPARRRAKPTTTCCEPDAPRAAVPQLPKDPPDDSTDGRKSASATRVRWSRIFIIAGSSARGSSSEAATTVGALLLRITYCAHIASRLGVVRRGFLVDSMFIHSNHGPAQNRVPEAPPRTENRTPRLSDAFLAHIGVQDDAHAESQPLVRKTLFWKTMDQIVPARISADFGRVANDDKRSGHPSRGSDPASGGRGAGSPSLVGGRGRGAEREAPAGSPSRVAKFVMHGSI